MQVRIQQRFAYFERVARNGQAEGMLRIVGEDKTLPRQRDDLHKGCIHEQAAPNADKRRYTIRIQRRELLRNTRNTYANDLFFAIDINGCGIVAFSTEISNMRQIKDGEFITGIKA